MIMSYYTGMKVVTGGLAFHETFLFIFTYNENVRSVSVTHPIGLVRFHSSDSFPVQSPSSGVNSTDYCARDEC